MRKPMLAAASLAALVGLSGCVNQPLGPTVSAFPPQGKSLSQFDEEDAYCQRYASDRVAGKIDRANDKIAQNTAVGALVGALLGAAVGNTRGAVVGGVAGSAVGASTADPGGKNYQAQREYNIAYAQCMKTKGNDIAPPREYRRYHDGDYPPPDYPPPDYPPPRD